MASELFYWIPGPWPGRLAIVARPRSGEWLEGEVQSWAREGLEIIVSLLTSEEAGEFDLAKEADVCRSRGIQFHAFPIPDRGTPGSRRETLRLVKELDRHLTAGKSVGIHCRQGIGRSGLITACLLVWAGETPDSAFERVSQARGCPVPETTEQREWVGAYVADLAAPTRRRQR